MMPGRGIALLGRRVSILNFWRDGYGILQTIDLAVGEVPRWKPDLVLMNFHHRRY